VGVAELGVKLGDRCGRRRGGASGKPSPKRLDRRLDPAAGIVRLTRAKFFCGRRGVGIKRRFGGKG